MKEGLLIVERIILEALDERELSFDELREQTGLDSVLMKNILENFLEDGIVLLDSRRNYKIDNQRKESWISKFNSRENVQEEVKDLFVSMVNEYFKEWDFLGKTSAVLSLKKVHFTSDEMEEFHSHLDQMEKFIKRVEEIPSNKKIGDKKVIVWGYGRYASLVENSFA